MLGYRSKNANKFFRRLDVEMLKEAEVSGKASRRRIRKLPRIPIPSTFKKAPKNLPVDFYDPEWFNQLAPGQKRLIADVKQVAFLPNAAQSLLPVHHPDEQLGDTLFAGKYLDVILEAYDLSEDDGGEFEGDGEEDFDNSDISIDLEKESEGSTSEEESDCFSEGDYGDLYDDEKEDTNK
ncbi:hypothetical protein CROQUDRAFT_102216, partial [Cronartium quercuum f. sp. fusiforme G11]